MTTPAEPTAHLILNRFFKVPRERIYSAWTIPEELMKWFGPPTCRATSARLEARVGGNYHLAISSELVGEVEIRGDYQEVRVPERLAFTWRWSGNSTLEFGESLVTVDLQAVDGGTDVQIKHELLPNLEVRDDHAHGWNGSLDKLAAHLGVGDCSQPSSGGFCWNELLASDTASASTFYGQLLGWESVAFPVPTTAYTIFKKQGRSIAGLMANPMPNVPPHWLAYVHVADVDTIASQAAALGGEICVPPMDVPTVGRLAVILDPQGAAFGIFKPVFA